MTGQGRQRNDMEERARGEILDEIVEATLFNMDKVRAHIGP